MNPSISKEGEGNRSVELESNLVESDINLAKKASRAFAVSYVNEIYNTIKSIDPSVIKKIKATKRYPYSLYVFIHQEKPGEIKQLDIYSKQKSNGDSLCEVEEIYHTNRSWDPSIKNKKKSLAAEGNNWRWSSLEISEMYVLARSEGRRVGRSIYSHCAPKSSKVRLKRRIPPSISSRNAHVRRSKMPA